jgi:hypothetical protein
MDFDNPWLHLGKHCLFLLTLGGTVVITALNTYIRPLGHWYVGLVIVALIILEYYNYQLHEWYSEWRHDRTVWRERRNEQQEKIETFLSCDLARCTASELESFVKTMQVHRFWDEALKGRKTALQNKLEETKRLLDKRQYEEEVRHLRNEKYALEEGIKTLSNIQHDATESSEERKERLLKELDLSKKVFLMEELTDETHQVLLEEGFVQVNEYDILSEQLVTALVRPPLKHSPTHAFLVWSVMQFLEEQEGVTRVEEHETRDADITFRYDKKYYAIEVETGSLLRKKKQLKEKVAYLNQKYHHRWLFVVSNKNLVSEYRKLGPATPRNGVEKNVLKMLKFLHP